MMGPSNRLCEDEGQSLVAEEGLWADPLVVEKYAIELSFTAAEFASQVADAGPRRAT